MGNSQTKTEVITTTTNSDDPKGCCFQFKKVTSNMSSEFDCCTKKVDVKTNGRNNVIKIKT